MRRNGRDERRRRVLREDQAGGEQRPEPSVRVDRDSPYQESARSDQQPKILDFVPRRAGVIFVIFMLQLSAVATLQSLHWAFFEASARMDRDWLAYFNMGRDGSLASWLIAVWFLVAAALCGVLFSIRRHRRDDFQGRYRVWAWLGVFLVAASGCAVSGFDGFAGEVVRRLAPEMGTLGHFQWSGLQWSVALVALVAVVVSTRMWFEFRESRAATGLVVLTLVVFAIAGAYRLEWIPNGAFEVRWLSVSLGTLGATLLVASCLVFCRFVILDAHGEIERRQSRRSRRQEAAESAAQEPSDDAGRDDRSARRHKKRRGDGESEETEAETGSQPKPMPKSKPKVEDEEADSGQSQSGQSQSAGRRKSPLGGHRKNGEQEHSAKAEPPTQSQKPPTVRIQRDTVEDPGNGPDDDLSEEQLARMSKAERRRHRKQQKKRRAA